MQLSPCSRARRTATTEPLAQQLLKPSLPSARKDPAQLKFCCSVVSDSLQPHGLQHARLPCPSQSPGIRSNSRPLSRWYHPTISSSVTPFSSCPRQPKKSKYISRIINNLKRKKGIKGTPWTSRKSISAEEQPVQSPLLSPILPTLSPPQALTQAI